MKHIFITTAGIHSPRWQQAFKEAEILSMDGWNSASINTVKLTTKHMTWLLLDGHDWLVSLEQILKTGTKVIAMTRAEDATQAKQAIAAGANGYVHYLAVPSLLQQVEQVVELGGVWVGAELMRQLMLANTSAQQQPLAPSLKLDILTPREQAVAEAVVTGHNNKEVARMLDITERTVKAHLSAIFEKLGVRDRLQLVLELRTRA